MSLKAFHIFFILLSILLMLGFGVWGVLDYRTSGKHIHLVMGLISVAFVPALVIYLKNVINKFRHLPNVS